MRLRALDLNLLVALDALLSERHVTRAAHRVGLSQPAMSNALGRLRQVFKDELLVRTSAGMIATPRALELLEPLRQALRQVERVLESDQGFDPKSSARTFNLRMSDILAYLILPGLLAGRPAASRITFNIVHTPPAATLNALERDEIDVAISMGLEAPSSIRARKLLDDRMVCLMRRDHPLARGKLTMERFLAQGHVKVSISPTDMRFVDDVLAERGQRRRIALNVPHWLVVPHVLQGSDLLAVLPRTLADAVQSEALTARELPFQSKPFAWTMYWHRRHDRSRPSLWLREKVAMAMSAA